MDLDELSIRVQRALHVRPARGGPGVDDGIRAPAKDNARSARGEHHRGRGNGADLHGAQVHRHGAHTAPLAIAHHAQPLPILVLGDLALGFVAADLLVQRVEQLLSGGRPREGGAVVHRSAEPSKVQQTLGGAVEGDAHPVQQIDDARGRVAHGLDRRLLGQEVAALERVLHVNVGVVALPLGVHRAIDPALRAHRV